MHLMKILSQAGADSKIMEIIAEHSKTDLYFRYESVKWL
jgi:hypothetical protein